MFVDEYIRQFKEVHRKVEILIAHVRRKCLSVALIERFFLTTKNNLRSSCGFKWFTISYHGTVNSRRWLNPWRKISIRSSSVFLLNVFGVVVCSSHGRLELTKEDPMQQIKNLIRYRRQRATEKLLLYWTWGNIRVSSG